MKSDTLRMELKSGDSFKNYVRNGKYMKHPLGDPEYPEHFNPKFELMLDVTLIKEGLYDDETLLDIVKPVKINEILPDFTQADYVRNFIKMFNLYLYNDKYDDKKITIEPRDDFYSKGETLNWTDKVDYNKKIKIEKIDVKKDFIFKYETGDDYNSRLYLDEFNETYGTYRITVDGYLDGIDETKLDFQSYTMRNSIVNSKMIQLNSEIDSNNFERSSYEPLIGFDNYLASFIIMAGNEIDNIHNTSVYNYLYATHAKVIGGVSYDLNFETNDETFTMDGYDSERGLYYIFWKNYLTNLIDEDARKVELYVDLTINDITNLDMRNKILIEGQVYILEKLEYDPSNDNSSKITLIKEIITVEGVFTPEDLLLLNDSGEFITTGNDDKIII
jgi:hypothetical protein